MYKEKAGLSKIKQYGNGALCMGMCEVFMFNVEWTLISMTLIKF
jgi:hypothetical protein